MTRVVDAHVHLGPPKYAAVDQYRQTMATDRIAAAILVQHMGNTDNSYLDAVRSADPERFVALAIVASLDHAPAVLESGFTGLRVAPTGLAGPDGDQIFDVLDQYQAAASITGPLSDVVSDAFRATVRSHPRVRFRIEHVGGFRYGTTDADREDFARLLRLADEPNVTLMWSGFFLNAGTEFPYANTYDDLRKTLHAFGSQRIMWSGDWNRAGLAPGDYQRAVDLVGLVVSDQEQRADILGRTAERVFGLGAYRRGGN